MGIDKCFQLRYNKKDETFFKEEMEMEAKKILMSICAALISVCVALSVVGCKKDEDAEAGSNLAYKLTGNGYVVNGFGANEVEAKGFAPLTIRV